MKDPFVRVEATNRDKRPLLSGLEPPTGTKGGSFCSGWCYHPGLNVQSLLSRLEPPTGTKGGPFVPVGASNRDKRPLSPPSGLASRWTRDKSHLLSRVQKQPGQMVWNKDIFCSSAFWYGGGGGSGGGSLFKAINGMYWEIYVLLF